MKKRAVFTRKIIIIVVLAAAIGACLLVWLISEPDDGLVPILATDCGRCSTGWIAAKPTQDSQST